MNAPLSPAQRRGRRMFLLLVAVFFGPLLVSFGLYYLTDWRPVGQTNNGELIAPPRPLPDAPAELTTDWSLVYVGDAACDEACQQALVVGRQTRIALNQEMTRVRRVLLATASCCESEYLAREHEGLVVLDGSTPAMAPLLAQFPAEDRAHSVYVVDPRGNLVMRYDARKEPKGFLTDLKKLLKLSHIG
jgi:hypothetical protein